MPHLVLLATYDTELGIEGSEIISIRHTDGIAALTNVAGSVDVLGQTSHAADLQVDGAYDPVEILAAFREPDGIALDQTGRFFVTADEGDTRNAAGSSAPRGGRTVSVFDADSGTLLGDTGSQIDDAAAEAGIYPDGRSNRGGSEPEVLDLTHCRGMTLVAVGLERANAVALIDVSDPDAPAVIDIESVGIGRRV